MFRVLKNAFFAVTGNVLSVPFQLLALVLIVRSLGPDLYGKYAFAQEYTVFIVCMAEAGLGIIVTRELSKHRDRAGWYLGNFYMLKLILVAAVFAVVTSLGFLFTSDRETIAAICILGGASVLFSFLPFYWGIFRAYERMIWEGISALLQPALFVSALCFIIYGLHERQNIRAMAAAMLLSCLLVVLFCAFIVKKTLVSAEWRLDRKLILFFFGEMIPPAVLLIVFDAIIRTCILMIKTFHSAAEVGYFTIGIRLTYQFGMLAAVLAGAWLPALTKNAHEDSERFDFNANQFVRMMLLLSAPLAGVVSFFAADLIVFFCGIDYLPAAPVLHVLALSIPMFFLLQVSKTMLESGGRQKYYTLPVVIGFGVNLVLSLLLISSNGAMGAAFSVAASFLSVVGFSFLRVWHHMNGKFIFSVFCRMGLSLILMITVFSISRRFPWILSLLLGIVCYFISLLVIKEVSLDEARRFIRFFGGRKIDGSI